MIINHLGGDIASPGGKVVNLRDTWSADAMKSRHSVLANRNNGRRVDLLYSS